MNRISLWMYNHPILFLATVGAAIAAMFVVLNSVLDGYNDRVCRDYGAWHHAEHTTRGLIACRQLGTNDLFFIDSRSFMILVPVEDSCRTYEFHGSP